MASFRLFNRTFEGRSMWNTVKFAKIRSEGCLPKFTFARALRHAETHTETEFT